MEFEAVWAMMLEEFVHEDVTLQKLYEIRKGWIPTFFKDDFCGLMVSTQHSDSMKKLMKNAHMDANTPLPEFVKQMMRLIYSRQMKEAKETLSCMVR